ncbi:DUF3139 domain-containing protein [Metabacillus idriensis]|uniref:DUF3139 domain-containing protein n=1 Tax=Metabacillus idriensis TaxID=324768 RepID=UPI00174E17C5|nr:DUF3139 domain-containing protein [Metabacillus idriensis]
MKRIMLISFAVVFPIILFSLYLSFFGNPIDKYQIVKATKEYLVEKGYDEQDILSIESDYHFKRNSDNMSGLVSYVVFKDESTIQYTYVQWKRSKEIQQHCTYYDLNNKSDKWHHTEQLKNFDSTCTQRDG